MKKTFTILLLTISLSLSAQKFDNAVDYMNYIGKEFKQVRKETWDYISSAAHGKRARKVENNRKTLVKQIGNSMTKLRAMPDYEGDGSYRDSAIAFLRISKHVINEDYAKLVDMEEISEQSYDNMEAYMTARRLAGEKMGQASDMFAETEKAFAKKHNITLQEAEDDKMARKLREADKVYDYYNEIFLTYFRPYKEEVYMIEAQNASDLEEMQQRRDSLLAFAKSGLAKLEGMQTYKADNSVREAAMQLMRFYIKEAEESYPEIENYYKKKQRFDELKKEFDAIPQNKRSKKEVDDFNKEVNKLNAAMEKFNSTNEKLNQDRSKYINNWNNASSRFTDKHVPKG